jgi:hypothetical protein
MVLKVEFPGGYDDEQSYLAQCLLGDFLGLEYEIDRAAAQQQVRIHDGVGHELRIESDLFTRPSNTWLTLASLPREPLAWWDASEIRAKLLNHRLPVLYGSPSFTRDDRSIRLGLDIFGGSFFFLAGLEEAVVKKCDTYDRFPVAESLSSRYGFLERPIVDEYVEVLWTCLHTLWPGLRRRRRVFRQKLTHDVDHLRFFLPRALAGDVKHRRLDLAAADIKLWLAIKSGQAADPYDTFDRIMDISEAAGVASAFYFITKWSNPTYDMSYVFDRRRTRALLKRISERGHEIGLHASYNAYLNRSRIAKEFGALKRVCGAVGVTQEQWGGRQHYLRWRTPDTFQHCDDAGLDYDTTLGHADAVGFRCGTCHEFPAFNLKTGQMLRLRERPLIAMDCTVIDPDFQNLGATSAAFDCFKALKDTCRHYDGEFTLLWHNSRLVDPGEASLYCAVVNA